MKKEIEVAHDSLETVGHVIDQFGNKVIKGTAQIISQGKDAILDSDSDNNNKKKKHSSFNSKLYSRFDSQVRAIQGDPNTYVEEPIDLDRYNKWKLDFSLEGKNEEMEGLLKENDEMESVFKRVVPKEVDRETFWFRYYYKVYKLKKAEDIRAKLVRQMSREEEEELSWDVEDEEYVDDNDDDDDENEGKEGGFDDDDDDGVVGVKRLSNGEVMCDSGGEKSKVEKSDSLLQNKMMEESKDDENLKVVQEKGDDGSKVDNVKGSEVDSEKKVTMERNVDDGKSLQDVTQNSEQEKEEIDLEWEEIEDHSRIDEKKGNDGNGSPSKIDLLKRLSSAAEEEDLSWDIEDEDDEAVKA